MNIGGRVSVSNLLWHACKHALHEQFRYCNKQCRILHPAKIHFQRTSERQLRLLCPLDHFGIPHVPSFQPLIRIHVFKTATKVTKTRHGVQTMRLNCCACDLGAQISSHESWIHPRVSGYNSTRVCLQNVIQIYDI